MTTYSKHISGISRDFPPPLVADGAATRGGKVPILEQTPQNFRLRRHVDLRWRSKLNRGGSPARYH